MKNADSSELEQHPVCARLISSVMAAAGIALRLGFEPRAVGCFAFARADEIVMDPSVAFWPEKDCLFLLGHEMCHIMQQRGGHVSASTRRGGMAMCIDRDLECEANEWGMQLSCGKMPRLPRLESTRLAMREPVAQPLLGLSGQYVQSEDQLTDRAQAVLSLINGGCAWFRWAASTTADSFHFPSEAQLVCGIQQGLHGSPLMFIRALGLTISPGKLLTLSTRDLNQILIGEESDQGNAVAIGAVQRTLAAEGVWTQSDLSLSQNFLKQVGLSGDPLFQVMSVADQGAVLAAISNTSLPTSSDAGIQKEAAQFAAGESVNAMEFADNYLFYIALAHKLASDRAGLDTPAARLQAASEAIENLNPVAQSYLRCPVVSPNISAQELRLFLRKWIDGRQHLGFPRLSAAMCQFMRWTPIINQNGVPAVEMADTHMSQVSQFINSPEHSTHTPWVRTLSQDGELNQFDITRKSGTATLGVDRTGGVTLRSFTPRTPNGA